MSAGDFMRRAVGNVSNTIAQASSTVTSVAQGRKRYDITDDAIEKCTLTVKCTPNKDAQTTTALSIKSGYLMKRNEQGQWQKRYICTVPHLFLYYFDSDSADSPRGVIDLELYTNITRHKNTLKAATNNEDQMRAFHFMSEDGNELNDWLAHFMRDRYFAVCEERNAYQQMQSELTAVLDTISCQTKAVEIDKEIIEKQLQDALLAKQEAMNILQSMLTIVGITEEEMSRLHDLNRIGHSLQTAIIRLKREVEMKFYGPDEVLEAEKAAHAEEVSELHERIELEVRARKNLEAMLLKQKKSAELQSAEYGSQIDTHLLNFQMMVACKAEADEKNANLSEQRRLLIKEVKRARGKLTETEASLEQVEGINTKLTSAVTALQLELAEVRKSLTDQAAQARVAQEEAEKRQHAAINAAVVAALDAVRKEKSSSGEEFNQAVDSGPTAPSSAVGGITLSTSSTSSDAQDTFTTTDTDKGAPEAPVITEAAFISPREVELLLLESQAIVSKLQPLYNHNNKSRERRTSSGSGSGIGTPPGSLSTSNSDSNLSLSIPGERPQGTADSASATPQTPMDLKGLGWLSPEQEKLVDSRIQLHQLQHPAVEAQYKYLDSSERTAATEGAIAGAAVAVTATSTDSTSAESESTPSAASMAVSSASAAASSTFSMFSGAMSMLSSTASATLHSATGHEDSAAVTPTPTTSQKRPPKGIISSIFLAEKDKPAGAEGENEILEEEEAERLPSAMRLNCLRCAGTVEGPKYSTCKCSVPALMPEDLHPTSSFSVGVGSSSSAWGFSMLSKSSSAFVGGLAMASQVTQSNVESLMKAAKATQQAPNTSSSDGNGSEASATKDKTAEGYLFYNSVVSSLVPVPATVETGAGSAAENADSAAAFDSSAATSSANQELPPEQDLWNYFVGSKEVKSDREANPDLSSLTAQNESCSVEGASLSALNADSAGTEQSSEINNIPASLESTPDPSSDRSEGNENKEEDISQENVESMRSEEISSELDSNTAFI